ncbi:hypothetical protein HMPREF9296_1947 [Prevotella disiens FB035-09AN]|uniref:Uncharacterized protein n=1 Tax=Prevotella disiens FB035-09AN TaxID=866771 RepID=E1KN92_9BACT|nr:hypothetical protein HMPREF9296_1947 [Prevotella disiens FB035-09AN]
MLPVAVLLGCKSKPSKALLQGMRKSRETLGEQENKQRKYVSIIAVMR